ncbi:MAG: DNA photolyase family protein [Alphaproteobacteria bacterium]|nr:DNA photolyase family protein [Alphaproteobacteria bacterium]MDE2041724.1 deoxyribodipyrimidine photo-lyase [Alphaproteobacteria bacterium]MDE2339659.1 deoxyribodipyrimidine photo-lyase [Alphaproteobacteria bacterium]
MSSALLWFRQDLRLHDHPALAAAVARGAVIPVYVLDDETPEEWRIGGAQRWWLHHSLSALARSLAVLSSRLILRRGRAADVLLGLMAETGADSIHAHRAYEPWWQRTDAEIAGEVTLHLHDGNHLANPRHLLNGAGARYRLFTPWFNRLLEQMPPPRPLPAPDHIPTPDTWPASDELADWALLPTCPDWSQGFGTWTPGEAGARAAFRAFLPKIADYAEVRDFPALPGTARLSPHIHFGEISPTTLWHHAAKQAGAHARTFLSEVAWREHGLNLVDQMPDYANSNGRAVFDSFPWRSGAEADADFTAWTRGQTGYPVVDAGMRELWQTGWMHNRVRMITASFLVKHLLIDWRRGERWFWDCLLDADLGANAMNWQYVAGSGVDAPVFSRMMAPLVQSPKFEMADYIRAFVPELAHLRDDEIHAPHETGVSPPGYPLPIIGHVEARARALAAWEAARTGHHDALADGGIALSGFDLIRM